jgi:hypothetical protein
VQGVVEAAKEIGGNVGNVAQAAVEGAIEAAGTISTNAVQVVRDLLVGVVEGLVSVAYAALPRPPRDFSATTEERETRAA